MSHPADACVEWVISEARKRRPQLYMVSRYDMELLLRHLYWHQRVADSLQTEAQLYEHAREWLNRRREIPWWVKLLLRTALTILVQLLLLWLATHMESRHES